MPATQLEMEQVAEQGDSREGKYQVGNTSIRQLPAEEDPGYVDIQDNRVYYQGRGQDVVYGNLDELVVPGVCLGTAHGPAAEQRDHHRGDEGIWMGKPVVTKFQVEQEADRSDYCGHYPHQEASDKEAESNLDGCVEDIPAIFFVPQGLFADYKEYQGEKVSYAYVPPSEFGLPQDQWNPEEPSQDVKDLHRITLPAELVQGVEQDIVREEPNEDVRLPPDGEYDEIGYAKHSFKGIILEARGESSADAP